MDTPTTEAAPNDATAQMRLMLQRAAGQFEAYAQGHREKAERADTTTTARGNALRKAETNEKWAKLCRDAARLGLVSITNGSPPSSIIMPGTNRLVDGVRVEYNGRKGTTIYGKVSGCPLNCTRVLWDGDDLARGELTDDLKVIPNDLPTVA